MRRGRGARTDRQAVARWRELESAGIAAGRRERGTSGRARLARSAREVAGSGAERSAARVSPCGARPTGANSAASRAEGRRKLRKRAKTVVFVCEARYTRSITKGKNYASVLRTMDQG